MRIEGTMYRALTRARAKSTAKNGCAARTNRCRQGCRRYQEEDGDLPTRSPTGVGAGGINCGRRYKGEELLRAGEVGAAVADLVIAGDDFDFDGTVAIGGAAGIGVVAEAVLGAQLAVNAIEDGAKVLSRVGIEHGAAGGVGHGFERVFAGGVAPAFVFHRADDDGVEQRVGAHRFLAGGVEVGAAGGFAGIGDEDDDAAAIVATALEGAGAKKDGVVNRGARAGRYPANGGLQSGNVVREGGDLGDVFIKREHGEAVARAQNLADEVRGGFLLEGDFLVRAQAGVDHQGEVQRLRSLGLENIDLLRHAFFKKLEGFAREIRSRAIVVVQDAHQDVDEIDVDADAAALSGGILRIFRRGGRRGLDDLSRFARGRGSGSLTGCGSRGLGLLRPGRTIRLVL